jgi:hypothetical protein
MTKYRAATPDIIESIKDLQNRLSILERTPQFPNTSVSGTGNSSYKVVTGSQIPTEVTGFYNFFGYDVFIAVIWSRGDADSYLYEVLVSGFGTPNDSVTKAVGTVHNGLLVHQYQMAIDSGIATIGNSLTWFSNFGNAQVLMGSNFFGGSQFKLQSNLVIDGLPNVSAWLMQGFTFAEASADLTLTTTPTNITGAVINNVLLPRGGSYVEVIGVFDFEETVAGTTVGVGDLVVDGGAVQSRKARFGMSAITDRATVMQKWSIPLTSGSDLVPHSYQLQGSKSIAAGTAIIRAASTNITIYCLTQ